MGEADHECFHSWISLTYMVYSYSQAGVNIKSCEHSNCLCTYVYVRTTLTCCLLLIMVISENTVITIVRHPGACCECFEYLSLLHSNSVHPGVIYIQ